MAKAKNGFFSTLLRSSYYLCKFLVQLFFLLLPTIILITLIETKQIEIPSARAVPKIVTNAEIIHDLFPNTKWEHLKPCGQFFNEEKEFKEALSCSLRVWPTGNLHEISLDLTPPRCFIVGVASPDLYGMKDFNFLPVQTIAGTQGVVGVYQPASRTVYIVENIDSALVYRHELQHFFLHLQEPWTRGGGHYQDIWKKCEPPYYTPSQKARLIGVLMNDEFKDE